LDILLYLGGGFACLVSLADEEEEEEEDSLETNDNRSKKELNVPLKGLQREMYLFLVLKHLGW